MVGNPKIKQVSSHNFDQLFHCLKDDSELQAKKKTFETSNISKFFLERATISNFFCATNQNNLRKYVSYDSRLLKPWKILHVNTPHTPRKFHLLAPPTPQEFSLTIRGGGGGMDIFWNHTMQKNCNFISEIRYLKVHPNFEKSVLHT